MVPRTPSKYPQLLGILAAGIAHSWVPFWEQHSLHKTRVPLCSHSGMGTPAVIVTGSDHGIVKAGPSGGLP